VTALQTTLRSPAFQNAQLDFVLASLVHSITYTLVICKDMSGRPQTPFGVWNSGYIDSHQFYICFPCILKDTDI
jgi:hypothetical protein